MHFSKVFPKPFRDNPHGDNSPGTNLLMRAGFLSRTAAGVWIMTPLALAVRRKVEAIVRDEMKAIGAIEVELPILQAREYWEETGRWNRYTGSNSAFTTKDRKGAEYMLAPTAEEVITAYARENLMSHRDLPVTFWQMSPKFRDEARPRQGLIRGREFLMKDAYSFAATPEAMSQEYDAMSRAYRRIFERCGFAPFIWVEADSGAIGGSGSTEFMAVTEYGEDYLLNCPSCKYGANQEKATTVFDYPVGDEKPLERIPTPDIKTVDQLSSALGVPAEQMVKTIVLVADGLKPVIVSMRGDLEISEVKLCNLIGAQSVEIANEEIVEQVTGAPVGFAGPIGLFDRDRVFNGQPVPYYFDHSVKGIQNFLCGGNEVDIHYVNVNVGRDFGLPNQYYDLSKVSAGHRCPKCDGTLTLSKGIELGHIFKLQQVYSKPMGASFADGQGNRVPYWMGCYGVGVSRIVQALAEQCYDKSGLVWPVKLAPFEMVVLPSGKAMLDEGFKVYEQLDNAFNGEVMFDDLGRSFGVSVNDAELIGYPIQIVVGRQWATQNKVEVRIRYHHTENRSTELRPDYRPVHMTVPEFIRWWKHEHEVGNVYTGNFS